MKIARWALELASVGLLIIGLFSPQKTATRGDVAAAALLVIVAVCNYGDPV